jgi:type VI secretion system VgrG family protein
MNADYSISINQHKLPSFYPIRLTITEELNTPFKGELFGIIKHPENIPSIIFNKISCVIHTNKDQRKFNGLITSVNHQIDSQLHLITLTIEPEMYKLQRDVLYQVFENQNAIQIAESILSRYKIKYEIRVKKTLPKLKLHIQYKESSLNFINRLFAAYGLYYTFEHTDSHHTMIIQDDMIFPRNSITRQKAKKVSVLNIKYKTKIHHSSIESDRYQIEHPQKTLRFCSYSKPRTHNLCQYTYPHSAEDNPQLQYLQKIENQRLQHNTLWDINTNQHTSSVGDTVNLTHHVVIIKIIHRYYFAQEKSTNYNNVTPYKNSITAVNCAHKHYDCKNYTVPIAAGVQLTRTEANKRPALANTHASVKLCFTWKYKHPIWVRTAQTQAGLHHGAMTTYRNNSTTIVEFQHNNPNNPVAIGQIYSKVQPNPFKKNIKHSSGVKSKSFSSSNNRHHQLCFNDKAGEESLQLSSGYNQIEHVGNNYNINSDNKLQQSIISGNQSIIIKKGYKHIQAKKINLACGSSRIIIDETGIHFNAEKIELTNGSQTSKPVARVGDQHTCPAFTGGIIPHQGGTIISGSDNVFINNKPAARQGDQLKCNTSQTKITKGNPNVLINNKPIARLSDQTMHNGKVIQGSNDVIS